MGTKLRGLNLGYMGMDMELMVFPHPNYLLTSQRHEAQKTWYQCPAISYIIEHPDGLILFETGISAHWGEEWQDDWKFLVDLSDVTPEKCLEARLKGLNLGPDDFRYVVQGHLHCDHAGGLRLFQDAGAEVVVHEDEYRYVTSNIETSGDFFVRKDWEFLGQKKPTLVNSEEELLKDVRMVSLPGHTAGTMGLMVRLERTGWALLTTDALYTHESYGPPSVGTPITHDVGQWASSVEKIRRLATEHDAFVFPGHSETGVKHDGEQVAIREIQFEPFVSGYVYE